MLCLFPVLCPLLPTWEAGSQQSHKAGHGMSNFHPALQGPVMEWGARHPHPSAQPFPWNSQWLRGQLRTRQVCAEDVPGLMGDGTGPPDGQAKVRQGDGHAAGAGLGREPWDPGVGADGSSPGPSAHALLALPGQAAGIWQQGEGKAKAGECSEGSGSTAGVSQPLGTACSSTLYSAAATREPSVPWRNQPPLSPLSHSFGISS